MQKLLGILLAIQLLVVPAPVFGQGNASFPQPEENVDVPQSGTSVDAAQQGKSISAKVSDNKEPRQASEEEADYTDPSSYPLLGKEEYVNLFDSYSSYQYVQYLDTVDSNEYYDAMNIQMYYGSEQAYSKDGIITFEFFYEENNYLNYIGNIEFDTYGYSGRYLYAHLPKSYYVNKPYIYMRVGLSENSSDEVYTYVETVKIANPYSSPVNPVTDDKYAIISNESTNYSSTQPTGTFNIKNQQYSMNKSLKSSAYKMDYDKPFDIPRNEWKALNKSSKAIEKSYNVGNYKYFWVSNLQYNYDYEISARLAYSGTKADIWVHNYEITDAEAEAMGKEFDNTIHTSVTNNFGPPSDVDNNGKVNILTFDIQDGFSGSGGYVGGYFWSGDLYNVSNSNRSETFYIDTYPAMGTYTKDVSSQYETLAHEFQHMVNFNQNIFVEGSSTNMETWLNEGLSMAAEQIYSGNGLSGRLEYYNYSTSIKNGHSLLYWDNYGDTLANYSLSYLFGQYIKIQANQGDRIFKEILKDPNNNYKAVENVAKKYISPNMTFGKLMTSFRMALLLKNPTGLYGFKGNAFFDDLEERIYSGSSANLRGGGAVVTTFNSEEGLAVPSTKGTDITYNIVDSDGGDVDGAPSFTPLKIQLNGEDFAGGGYFGNKTTYVNWNALKVFKIPYTYEGNGVFIIEGRTVKGEAINGNWYIKWSLLSPEKITYKVIDGGYNFIYTTPIKIQLNGQDFTQGGYFRNNTTYVNWNALKVLKIPYTYKGNGEFVIEGRTVIGEAINGNWYIKWSLLSPEKITYKVIDGGYNFIYTTPIKIQLNGKDFTQGGYFRNNTTYVNWDALKVFKIPYTYKGNGEFVIEGRTVIGEAINGNWYIKWSLLSPEKISYKVIDGGYNFIYTTPIKIQLNGRDFTQGGYFRNNTTYVNWNALKVLKIPYTYEGNGVFIIEGRTVKGEAINGNWYIQWSLLSPGKISYKVIDGGYNFIYTTPIKIQVNGRDFTQGGYFRNNTTYVNWNALKVLKIPYTYKGNGEFVIEGRTVVGEAINGNWYIQWSLLSPGKITYKVIDGGYNFIYTTPIKIQLNGRDFTQGGYFRNNTTYVNWNALKVLKIPYTYEGNGVFIIEGRTVKGEAINGNWYIQWSLLSPGKISYNVIDGGYNFIYTTPIKIQLNGRDFTLGGYFRNNTTYVNWNALKVLKIPYTYEGNGVFIIEGRTVKGEAISGNWYIRWSLLSPEKITYQTITGGYNFIYKP